MNVPAPRRYKDIWRHLSEPTPVAIQAVVNVTLHEFVRAGRTNRHGGG